MFAKITYFIVHVNIPIVGVFLIIGEAGGGNCSLGYVDCTTLKGTY